MNLESDEVIQLIKAEKKDVYLVGGAVRDYFMGKTTNDKDILVEDSEIFAKEFAKHNDATFIELDNKNKIYRVVLKDKINYVDITQPINNSLIDDLKRRDFTINAIAINLKNSEIIDVVNGKKDIESGLIRIISEENIIEDPLRILRAYRFAAMTGFEIEENTKKILEKCSNLVLKSAKERINYEIMKLFSGKYTAKILLEISDLIEKIYPIFIDVKKVPKNTHHHLGLYEHSAETVKQIQNIYETSSEEVKTHLNSIDFGGFNRLAHLKFAGFMHDIGKFSTWTIEGDRHRFIKHDDVGSKMSKEILKQNKFSKKQIEYISMMIKNHIYPSHVVSAEKVNEKIYMRYIRKMGNNVIDNIILAKADRLSARGPAITDDIIEENIKNLDKLLNYYLEVKETLKPLPKLLSGKEIMQILNITPSPKLGEIINEVKQLQFDGIIITKEQAIKYIKNIKIKL